MVDPPDSYADYPNSFRWPYPDLPLRQRTCPSCGASPAAELVDKAIAPLYFCVNEHCPVWAWDPTKHHEGDT